MSPMCPEYSVTYISQEGHQPSHARSPYFRRFHGARAASPSQERGAVRSSARLAHVRDCRGGNRIFLRRPSNMPVPTCHSGRWCRCSSRQRRRSPGSGTPRSTIRVQAVCRRSWKRHSDFRPLLRRLPCLLEALDRASSDRCVDSVASGRSRRCRSVPRRNEVPRLPVREMCGPRLERLQGTRVQRDGPASSRVRLAVAHGEPLVLEVNLSPRQ